MLGIPWWGMLLIQVLNMLLSNGAVALATFVSSGGDANAATVAGAGSLINHMRQNPLGIPEMKSKLEHKDRIL